MKSNQQREKKVDLSTMIYGKVPPQAKDLEVAVLGAILQEGEAFDNASTILTDASFYVDAHQRIYRAAAHLSKVGQPVDILTVVNQLRASDELELVGGPYYVTQLTNSVVSSANIEAHCRIIQQKFIQRELIRISGEIISEAYEDSADAFDLLDAAEEKFLAIGSSNIQGDMVPIETVVTKALSKVEQNRLNDNSITGVPSGFPSLDRATRGWQPGLIILAARPSVGKSAVALTLVEAASNNPVKSVAVGLWSLEMEAVQNVLRMLAAKSEVWLHRIQTGKLEDEQVKKLYQAGTELSRRKIFFDDHPGLTLMSLRAKARRLKRKHNIGLIIVDYLQLISGSGEKMTREQEIARISRGLKMLSRELGIPVIALSQMSRDIEKRSGKNRVPQLSDIRESGAIEQDADVVIFLWGPEEEEIENDKSLLTRRYARIAKQRDGVLVTVDLDFITEIQKITEHEKDEFNNPAPSKSSLPIELPTGSGQRWVPYKEDPF
jgi:replicative DNA helicase